MVPYFSYLQYTDSEYQGSTGTIIGVQSLEGVGTVTVTWVGPNGYTAGPFTMPTHPDLTGLEPGTYTGTIIDSNLDETTLDIVIGELDEVILVATDTNLCDCKGCNGIIDITDFQYNSDCFTYNLYDVDHVLVATYSSCYGDVKYTFTDLCAGQYFLEAVQDDCLVYTYSNPDNCDQGDVDIDNNLDVDVIVANWRRFAISDQYFDFVFALNSPKNGTTSLHSLPGGSGAWSGLLQDKSIDYSNKTAYFYTGGNPASYTDPVPIPGRIIGTTGTTPVDPDATRFLGAFNGGRDGLIDPENIPGFPLVAVNPTAPTVSQYNMLYWYNLDNDKFVYARDVLGFGGIAPAPITKWEWVTFRAEEIIQITLPSGPLSWPNATDFYTGPLSAPFTDQWTVPATGPNDYTIDPDNGNNVILANALPIYPSIPGTGPVLKKIECTNNSIIVNGFFSDCKFLTYTHEITIGSESGDDDVISIILARYVEVNTDDPLNEFETTHLLTLDFILKNGSTNIGPMVSIGYNSNGGDNNNINMNAFNNGLEVNDPGFKATALVLAKTGISQPLPSSKAWNQAGKVRVRITRSGNLGESFRIQLTDTLGTLGTVLPGNPAPYNYDFSFLLNDDSTWDAGSFTKDSNALLKFLGPSEYGYATHSQSLTDFYHILFRGEQTNITDGREQCEVITPYETEDCNIYKITACLDSTNTRKIRVPGLIITPILDENKIYKFSFAEGAPEFNDLCWEIEKIPACEQDTIQADPTDEYDDCEECNPPQNTCWDLVNCNGDCDDIFSISSFDFTPYIGLLVTVNGDLGCVYSPVELRQASYINLKTSTLSSPTSALQTGASNIILDLQSLVFNGVEQIIGATPQSIVTASNYNPVECDGFACLPVPVNTTENGFTNIPDFLNSVFNNLNLPLEAYTSDPTTCDIPGMQNEEIFKIQYRDGYDFTLLLRVIYGGLTYNITLDTTGNVSTQAIIANGIDVQFDTCNTTFYCTDPTPDGITSVELWDAPCPIDLGEACELTPRLGEPGFSVKNCDPNTVIKVKTNFANAVYAMFKRARYGIDTCCDFDLDEIDIKNQLIDLGAIYDPELCIDGDPIPEGCCLQPCSATAELIVPMAVTCPAPVGPVITDITTAPIPVPCLQPTGDNGSTNPIRARVTIG